MAIKRLLRKSIDDDRAVRRDKEKTKRKLIQSAGVVLRVKGLNNTTSAEIARHAGVDRKLINRYFTNLQGLLEAYVIQQDYWLTYARELRKEPGSVRANHIREICISLLVNQFTYFCENVPMQNLIMMEICSKTALMSSISRIREDRGAEFIKAAENYFVGTGIDIRAIATIAIAGTYYSVLHSRNNDSTFCGLNLRDLQDRERIREGLRSMITLAFDAAAAKKSVEQLKPPGHERARNYGIP